MSRSTSPCNPSRCGSQTRAPKTNRDTAAHFRILPAGFETCYVGGMSATELIKEIQRLPEAEREQIFEFVLHAQKPAWTHPRPPGYFAGCYADDEIEVSNWLANQGPKTIVP